MHFRSKLLLTALVALVAASFAPGAFAAVKLRALHAIPDVGPVTVYVNGQPAVPSLGTLQETPYLEVPAGNYKVQVAPQGQPHGGRATVGVAHDVQGTVPVTFDQSGDEIGLQIVCWAG